MDPIHLLPEELNYELDIRGVFNLSTSRQKTTCLREFLRREEEGEHTISRARLEQSNSTSELVACGKTLENVMSIMQEESFDVSLRQDCNSRLIHLISRIKRAKPTSPEEQTLVYEILLAAEAQLSKFNRALVASSASRPVSRPASILTSPLAEVLETIQAAKRASSSSSNSLNGLMVERQNNTQGGRRSTLNPSVPSFVPVEQAIQNMNLESDRQVNNATPAIGIGERNSAFRDINVDRSGQVDRSGSYPVPQPHNNAFRNVQVDRSGPYPVLHTNNNAFSGIQVDRSGPYSVSQPNNNAFRGIQVDRPGPYAVPQAQNNAFQISQMNRTEPFPVSQLSSANRAAIFQNSANEHRFREPQLPAQVSPVSDRRGDEVYDRVSQHNLGRQYRKAVPVHQWKLSFSGEGQGLHLYDFLSELRMFQRSEGVSDDELFGSVVHLLSGRARLWYRSWFDTFQNWSELVAAMKREFLPPKYDYKLLTTISNRRQKPTETFAEYLNWMQSSFKHLSIPVVEQHKLCIIEDNMLAKYAIATSVVEITSIEQLSNICRRVDMAYAKPQYFSQQDRAVEPRQPFRQNQGQGRYRDLHELDMPPLSSGMGRTADVLYDFMAHDLDLSENQQRDVFEVMQNNPRDARNKQEADSRKCFNCGRVGHNFSSCPSQKNGLFCYKCGSRNVTTFNCKVCTKNGLVVSAVCESSPNPHKQ